jgi:hypothetical protein
VRELDAGRVHEQRQAEMAGGADAGRAEVDLVGPRFRQRHEVRKRLGLDFGIDHHQHRHVGDDRDRRERRLRIKRHLGVEELVSSQNTGRRHQQSIAVGLGLRDRIGASVAARTGAVLDDHRLAERLRHFIPNKACQYVDEPTGGKRRDQAHRAVRISLRGGFGRAQRDERNAGNHGFDRAIHHAVSCSHSCDVAKLHSPWPTPR